MHGFEPHFRTLTQYGIANVSVVQYTYRYSFAIVGINLTHMAYRMLVDGSAKTHFFNAAANAEDLRYGKRKLS